MILMVSFRTTLIKIRLFLFEIYIWQHSFQFSTCGKLKVGGAKLLVQSRHKNGMKRRNWSRGGLQSGLQHNILYMRFSNRMCIKISADFELSADTG